MRSIFLMLFPLVLFAEMTLEEKVGQLFVAPLNPNHSEKHLDDWKQLMESCHVGGAIVMQGEPNSYLYGINYLQTLSKNPMLMMTDAEWGLSMRMKTVAAFPKNMTLGAIEDISLIEAMGKEVGRQCRALGLHMNLAPVVDVNNNRENPVIHMRSFGDNPLEVTKRGEAITRGMQESGLLTCLKHFPGHGDTTIDSHFNLPVINHPIERLLEVELPPFQQVPCDAIMTAHILFPALDATLPATLSSPILTDLLRKKMGYEGLIITDALNMHALTKFYSPEEIALRAHIAGADLLLYSDCQFEVVDELVNDHIPKAYAKVLAAYKNGDLPLSRLDESLARIEKAKSSVKSPEIAAANDLKQTLFEAAITQLGPDFEPLDPDVAYLSFGDSKSDLLTSAFCPCVIHNWERRDELYDCGRIVISLRNVEPRLKNYGLSQEQIDFFHELATKREVIFCLFGTPYAAALLPSNSTILIGYEIDAQSAVLKVLTGRIKPVGKIPVQIFL